MSDPSYRADCCRGLAEASHRIAVIFFPPETQHHDLPLAGHYSLLTHLEEHGALVYGH